MNRWLAENEDVVVDAVARQAPAWSPRFVDEAVALRVYREVVRVAGEVQRRHRAPASPVGGPVPGPTGRDLQDDLETIHRAEQLKAGLLAHPAVRSADGRPGGSVRSGPDGGRVEPGQRAAPPGDRGGGVVRGRLASDDRLRAKVDGWLEDAAAYLVTTYRDELTATITETVNRWDGEETARKVELAVGRDLQFIRINGTLVGGLAGIGIHALTQLLL